MSIEDTGSLTKLFGRRPHILVLGDPADTARYHPLDNLLLALEDLKEEADLVIQTDYQQLAAVEVPFANVDIIINYIDNWMYLDEWQRSRLASRLLVWVAGGGALLTIHNGIITQETPELLEMHGGAFTKHDARTTLRFELTEEADPLLQEGFTPYEELDEPYEYRFSTFFDEGYTVWLKYLYNDAWHPAGWHRQYGEGTMLYLMPGHDATACMNDNFKLLCKNACRYLLNDLKDKTP